MNASSLIHHFKMLPHPEGGCYVQTYKSEGCIPGKALPEGWGTHAFSTGILFLLRQGEYSHLHRIRQDEMWHFYLGGPLRLALLAPDGAYSEIILGPNVLAGQHVQYVVPSGVWFGATPCSESAFSFVGCTVAPGFEFADFELAERTTLLRAFPEQAKAISEFSLARR